MIGEVSHDVIGVEQRLLDEPADVFVPRQVVDVGTYPATPYQTGETQLGEMLGDCLGPGPNVIGELVDGVLTVQQSPQNTEPGLIGNELQRLDRSLYLMISRNTTYLRIHAGT